MFPLASICGIRVWRKGTLSRVIVRSLFHFYYDLLEIYDVHVSICNDVVGCVRCHQIIDQLAI